MSESEHIKIDKIKLSKLSIIGFIGLIACASISPISLLFNLKIGGFADALLIGSYAGFFGILILLGVIQE